MLYCSYITHIFPHYTNLPIFQGNRILSGEHFTKVVFTPSSASAAWLWCHTWLSVPAWADWAPYAL